jgi:hypothetical protein
MRRVNLFTGEASRFHCADASIFFQIARPWSRRRARGTPPPKSVAPRLAIVPRKFCRKSMNPYSSNPRQGSNCVSIATKLAMRMAHLRRMARGRCGLNHSTAAKRDAPSKQIPEMCRRA